MVEVINGTAYYTVAEFAALLRLSQKTIERWITEGKLRYFQVTTGGHLRIPASELERHLHPKQ